MKGQKVDLFPKETRIGFLGLGQMGGRMVSNLLKAHFKVMAFDPLEDRLAACAAAGAISASDASEAVRAGKIVMTSLRSSQMFVRVAEETLLPRAEEGQIFLDMGTTEAPETRRLAELFEAKGATLMDCPVSGPPGPTMHCFVGGREEIFPQIKPVLDATADPERVVYCGPSGTGQVTKAVNQLGMGLVAAAFVEAAGFGILADVRPEAIIQGVGGDEPWRRQIADTTRAIQEGRGNDILVKFPELPYFLREAREKGFSLPLTEALFQFLDLGPRDWKDNMGRPRVAFWQMLTDSKPGGRG